MNEEKQLEAYGKELKQGRVKHSLYFSLMLLVGFGISNFLMGKGPYWLFMQAWISFPVSFVISYFMFWPMRVKRIVKEIGRVKAGEFVASQGSQTGAWIAVVVIFCVLSALPLSRGIIHDWAVNRLEKAVVDVKIGDGNKTVKLKIPQLYVRKEHNKQLGMSFMGESQPKGIILMAGFNDMKPLPIKRANKKKINERTVIYYSKANSPSTNRGIIAIEMKPTRSRLSGKAIRSVYADMMRKGARSDISEENKAGLQIRSAKLELPNPKGKGVVKVKKAQLGVPVDLSDQDKLVACDDRVCTLMTNIEGVCDVSIYFHVSKLSEWKTVYLKSERLLKSFVQK